MSYLKLENVKKVYNNKVTAVDNFNLEIEKGEFIAFLGPSGCGKTTTLRMIAGLESVTHGDITLEGKSIVGLTPRERGISMIFQSYAVWPHMTVYENVAYALKLRKLKKADIDEVVQDVAKTTDIVQYLNRYPSQLSGGQRQRVAVARAIAVKPKLFLMDEPLSNLDAKLRVSMRTDLKRIHQNVKSTSIFVTHDQSEALSLADRIVVMNHGVIEQIGTANEIYHESETMFIAKFIGSPASNFFVVNVILEDGEVYLVHDDFKVQFNGQEKDVLIKNYLDKSVVLSIRPENFTVNKGGFIKAKAKIIEPQGSHIIINTDIGGEEIKIVSDLLELESGENILLGFNDKVLLFDSETEKRIK
ncbi:MAG: ABC transporter ATP-binding protein [Tissierellaceae bacterium]|nr:ABC transporter ATP-binding protein [Tissierellaceae bacterium]